MMPYSFRLSLDRRLGRGDLQNRVLVQHVTRRNLDRDGFSAGRRQLFLPLEVSLDIQPIGDITLGDPSERGGGGRVEMVAVWLRTFAPPRRESGAGRNSLSSPIVY